MSKPEYRAEEPIHLNKRAEDNLRFIRAAMENAGVFTGISGLGYMLTGATAIGAAWLASIQTDGRAWFWIWMSELVLATVVASSLTFLKTRRQGKSLRQVTTRKLLAAFLPTMVAGGVFSLLFYQRDLIDLLPGMWLTLYGAAVITAGAWSVRVLPLMGLLFMALGVFALLLPQFGDVWMALGFGSLHLVFGAMIWRHYGG